MARLNEPAASLESIESLKRKYKRQNRDIASVNSSQAVRIRSLENENSKLLAENLELREENLRLRSEIDNGKARRVTERVSVVKSQLEERLVEIGALISSLGEESPERKRSPHLPRQFGGLRSGSNPPRSPQEKKWDNMAPLSEDDIGSPDGKLPPILENKYYPRRTLEHQEIENMLAEVVADTTDSPDIGPPPVSQFVDEVPVKIDLTDKVVSEKEDEPSLDPIISTNLEQRKRRKDSIMASDLKRISRSEPSQAPRENTGTLKSGAKRKLSARDDEEIEPTKANEIDDFQFTRVSSEERTKNRSVISSAQENTKPLKDIKSSKGLSKDKPALGPNNRKVLAAKSVNNSPKKGASTRILSQDNTKPGKLNMFKESLSNEVPIEKQVGKTEPLSQIVEPQLQLFNFQQGPETPAPADTFSPSSAHPSTTVQEESRDTPPPSESAEGHRPSRRARGSISYAEPNLRVKMRRPGKEFVNAVTADGKVRATRVEGEAGPATTSKIKVEPESEDNWQRLSAAPNADHSPLSGKTSVPITDMLSSNITDHRKRRESILHLAESAPSATKSTAEIFAESRKIKAKSMEQSAKSDDIKAALEDMDIYEFQGSPKRDSDGLPKVVKEEKVERVSSRFSRRASAMSAADLNNLQESEAGKRITALAAPAPVASRRRQSTMPSSARSASVAGTESERDATDSEKSLRRSVSNASMAGAAAAARSDRMSARRRSMML
ncbi:hypothetical protein EYC84_010621 [Monilinia fructicola]|uniref:Shugoshin C-terminal domain-containing protein n=1 Tax=Monilinia fructicola TaxID=38448 RepID=A0A5M9J8G6_MONFR|nr:hypothetical protein EYC84_010621 [Monilinia fructicola]